MKKVLLVIGGLLIVIAIFFLLKGSSDIKYTIKVNLVDDHSPDRILMVYKNDEKIDVKRIEYMDGVLLCNGYNTAVHFGDIQNIEELKVILIDNSEVVAKIVDEEVK